MLILSHASLASVNQLFKYKYQNFTLPDFPGYTDDQWGIKAHNRPWIVEVGNFCKDQKIMEVGGAYSLLPMHIAKKYELEAWIADDFGQSTSESIWSRWGNPYNLPKKYPNIKYVFEPFGNFSQSYPDEYFDRIFSVSTLEHIDINKRLDVIKDMNRCLKPGGMQIHSIDIINLNIFNIIVSSIKDRLQLFVKLFKLHNSEIMSWINIFKKADVKIKTSIPNSINLLNRSTLVESYDVVYRFYPPNNMYKDYFPSASLLLIINKV